MNSCNKTMPVVLSIAGSDSGSGAGIQADLKTCAALNTFACTAITAVTAQNTQGVQSVEFLEPQLIKEQCNNVFSDFQVQCIKIGMLGNQEIVSAVAEIVQTFNDCPVILDPVMVSSSGSSLLSLDARDTLKKELIPKALLITPNIFEAEKLLNKSIPTNKKEMHHVLEQLLMLGSENVLLKGGHIESNKSTDLFFDGNQILFLDAPRVNTKNTHGTGCTLSTAIAAFVAQKIPLKEAVVNAKKYVYKCIAAADNLHLGLKENGPIHHFHDFFKV